MTSYKFLMYIDCFDTLLSPPPITLQKKHDVVKPLRTLRKNGWNIPELLRAMLTIFQW